jgi:hypothetical protein
MQTAYSVLAPEGLLGLAVEDFTNFTDTAIPTVSVKVGKLLVADTTVGQVRNKARYPAAAADITTKAKLFGVTRYDQSREGGVDYPALRPTPVLRRGRIWVTAESAVTRFTPAFVRFASGAGGTELGSFRADADTATAAQCDWATFISDATAGALVLVEISIY